VRVGWRWYRRGTSRQRRRGRRAVRAAKRPAAAGAANATGDAADATVFGGAPVRSRHNQTNQPMRWGTPGNRSPAAAPLKRTVGNRFGEHGRQRCRAKQPRAHRTRGDLTKETPARRKIDQRAAQLVPVAKHRAGQSRPARCFPSEWQTMTLPRGIPAGV
jgi:hypothetical protein